MKKAKAAMKVRPDRISGPDDRSVYRLFLKTGASPEMVYDAVTEVRELASHNIVVALQAHATEVGSKLDSHKAETDARLRAIDRKLDSHKAETDARFDAMNHKLETTRSEIGSLRTMMVATMSLVGLLVAFVGVLGSLGIYKLVFEAGASNAVASPPLPAVAISEPATEPQESVPATPATPR